MHISVLFTLQKAWQKGKRFIMTWNIFDHKLIFSFCNRLFFILFNEYKEYNIRNISYLIKITRLIIIYKDLSPIHSNPGIFQWILCRIWTKDYLLASDCSGYCILYYIEPKVETVSLQFILLWNLFFLEH